MARAALTTRAAATTDEPLVVELPNGQSITLAVAIPVAAEAEDPGTDPTDPADPSDPGTTPGAGTGGDVDGGAGLDTDGDGTVDVVVPDQAGGELAYTGADLTGPAVAAGLLLLAGISGLVVARRKRAQRVEPVTTD